MKVKIDKGEFTIPASLRMLVSVIIISMACVTDVLADGEENLIGSWVGTVWVIKNGKEVPVRVDLTIEAVKGAQKKNKFHYSEPRACKLTPEYVATRNEKYWFVLKSPSGNDCLKISPPSSSSPGHLILVLKEGGAELSYEVSSSDDAFKESGDLKRQ